MDFLVAFLFGLLVGLYLGNKSYRKKANSFFKRVRKSLMKYGRKED